MKKQNGAAMTEFALTALLFFIVLFSIIEIGRWMFTWNTLVEATRRGARIAAVCPFSDGYIRVATVFGNPASGDIQNSPILPGLSTGNVTVTYYKVTANGSNPSEGIYKIPANTFVGSVPAAQQPNIKLVEVSINYSHNFIAPVIGQILGTITAPTFSTILPVESLGDRQVVPPNHC